MHSENDSDFFESANAFVFTDDRFLESKDTPLYLLRMMDSTPYYLDEIVNTYLSAQQVVIDKIKRLWFNSLDKQSKFVISGAIENAKTGILPDSIYDLETVTGKGSEVQRWVVLALAADAAKYGQGHQLFASKSADTIQSGIIAAKYPGRKPAPDIADFSNYWKIISACSIILWCTGYLCLVSEETFNIHPWYSIVPFVVGILVIFIAVLFFSIFVSDKIEQEMGIYYVPFL
ncbi:hypothetical protein [Citrobacter freundii]|uniref:hypothetical protein n=1 Tax=Citrobacter freundii TaxID=546 RepID=UPI003F922F7F